MITYICAKILLRSLKGFFLLLTYALDYADLGYFFITFMYILAIVHSQDPSTNLYDALEN